jgi:hypothetical protein
VNARQFLALALIIVVFTQIPAWATAYRYQGDNNIKTVVNQHATRIDNLGSQLVELAARLDGAPLATVINTHRTQINNLRSQVVELAAMLDADGGVTRTDYESSIAADSAGITSSNASGLAAYTDFEITITTGGDSATVTSTAASHTLSRGQ